MKKLVIVLAVLALVAVPSAAVAGGPGGGNTCTTIQDGLCLHLMARSSPQAMTRGATTTRRGIFANGGYCDAYRNASWCQAYKDVNLLMKWNDAWLSNKDCGGDGLLDRHYGLASYIGSGAWTTNHQSGAYIGEDGQRAPMGITLSRSSPSPLPTMTAQITAAVKSGATFVRSKAGQGHGDGK